MKVAYASVGTVLLLALSAQPALGQPEGDGATRGFIVQCAFSHSADVDPIVMPGHAGMSHLHEFFGNTGTDENSTGPSLLAGSTTCRNPHDLSAYWVPALYQDGVRIPPMSMVARYEVTGLEVTAFPAGFMAVSGRSDQTAAWGCVARGRRPLPGAGVGAPPTCDAGSHLIAQITFPSCWDGTSLDSADHISHLVFAQPPTGRAPWACPTDHPVRVPRVILTVIYPATAAGGSGVRLASGNAATLHADMFQAWTGTSLQNRINGRRGTLLNSG